MCQHPLPPYVFIHLVTSAPEPRDSLPGISRGGHLNETGNFSISGVRLSRGPFPRAFALKGPSSWSDVENGLILAILLVETA